MTLGSQTYKVQLTIPMKSGVIKDYAQIGFHYTFLTGTPAALDFAALVTRFSNWFQNTATGAGSSIQTWLANTVATTPAPVSVKFYHLPTSPGAAGPPVYIGNAFITSPASGAEPAEVAVAFTLAADVTGIPEFGPGGTRPRSDRRNRFYLGPLDGLVKLIDATTGKVTVRSSFRTDVELATKQELQAGAFADGWSLQVMSHKNWSSLGALSISADDTFDTVRRRRPAPASKVITTF